MFMPNEPVIATIERMDSLIFSIRGRRVILDSDLAVFYKVSTRHLNQAMKRNFERFPENFAFQITRQEFTTLMSQTVISKTGRGGRQKMPWVFTEHGVIMLASLLSSPVAVEASLRIVTAFVYLREQIATNAELARKFAELETRFDGHDEAIASLLKRSVRCWNRLCQKSNAR